MPDGGAVSNHQYAGLDPNTSFIRLTFEIADVMFLDTTARNILSIPLELIWYSSSS